LKGGSIVKSHELYAGFLGLLFLLWWIVLAVRPLDRKDWALENALVVVIVGTLVATRRRFPFSRISYTLLFLFLCLHEVGAHYTYAKVPYDHWLEILTGGRYDHLAALHRNHFDRLAHFSFGLLCAYPIREVFLRVAEARGFWGYYLPLDVTMAFSMVFEILEWVVAQIFGGNLGIAYLGSQGDVWDAQKDMGLACLGAILAMTVTAAINLRLQRDFGREWAESLRVKGRRPLGENVLLRLLTRRKRKTDLSA